MVLGTFTYYKVLKFPCFYYPDEEAAKPAPANEALAAEENAGVAPLYASSSQDRRQQ